MQIVRKQDQSFKSFKSFFRTISGKYSLSMLEKFITESVLPQLKYRPCGIHDLDAEKMVKFFEENSLCS